MMVRPAAPARKGREDFTSPRTPLWDIYEQMKRSGGQA